MDNRPTKHPFPSTASVLEIVDNFALRAPFACAKFQGGNEVITVVLIFISLTMLASNSQFREGPVRAQ